MFDRFNVFNAFVRNGSLGCISSTCTKLSWIYVFRNRSLCHFAMIARRLVCICVFVSRSATAVCAVFPFGAHRVRRRGTFAATERIFFRFNAFSVCFLCVLIGFPALFLISQVFDVLSAANGARFVRMRLLRRRARGFFAHMVSVRCK